MGAPAHPAACSRAPGPGCLRAPLVRAGSGQGAKLPADDIFIGNAFGVLSKL
jgi:hypothetical protein